MILAAALLLQAAAPLPFCPVRKPFFQASRRFDGIMYDGPEHQWFFENATSPQTALGHPRVAISLRDAAAMPTFARRVHFTGQRHLYRLTFVGQARNVPPPSPDGCLALPSFAANRGIAISDVTRLDDLGPAPKSSFDSLR